MGFWSGFKEEWNKAPRYDNRRMWSCPPPNARKEIPEPPSPVVEEGPSDREIRRAIRGLQKVERDLR